MCESRDCFNCPYPDCIVDGISHEEYQGSRHRDSETRRLNASNRRERYAFSEKRKACNKRYQQTEKGKRAAREATKRYYEKNREKILEKARLRNLAKKQGVI